MKTKGAIFGLIPILILALAAAAYGMTSTNYGLWPSDTNSGGGSRSSTSYTMQMDTVGQGVTGGALSSTSYNLESGILLAMGGTPDIGSSPTSMSFGSVEVGHESTPQSLLIQNNGDGPLYISDAYFTGTDSAMFNAVAGGGSPCPDTPASLPAGASCTLSVTFMPSSSGAKTAALSIFSDDPDTPQYDVSMSGTGVQTYTLAVSTAGTGLGNVVSTDFFIACGDGTVNDCTEDYEDGTLVELTATPSAGSTFAGWSGAGSGCVSGTDNPCSFNIGTNTSVTATFNSAATEADLDVYLMAEQNPVAVGEGVTYLIDVYNSGPATATSAVLTYTLPQGMFYLSASTSQGSCGYSAGTVTCNIGDMASAAMVYVDITAMPLYPSSVDNTASVTSGTTDPVGSNNSYTEALVVYPRPFKGVDFDGNGKKDVAVFRPSTGQWFFSDETKSYVDWVQFGLPGDIPVPADYTGDGVTNVAVFRPSTGQWFITDKTKSFVNAVQFGQTGDIPIPGMYNGAGPAELAIFRPGTGQWFMTDRFKGYVNFVQFGLTGDIPIPRDYNGDGKTNVAIYRLSTGQWFFTDRTKSYVDFAQFGQAGDIPIPEMYNVAGTVEVAVYRPSTGQWFFTDTTKSYVNFVQFGQAGDIPVTADYDADGKTNLAMFRPSTGQWFSTDRTKSVVDFVQFGMNGDRPLPGDYDGVDGANVSVFRSSDGYRYISNFGKTFVYSFPFGTTGDFPF